ETQAADVERRIAWGLAAERIEMGGEVAEVSVGPDERVGCRNVLEVVQTRSREHGARSRRQSRQRCGNDSCSLLRAPCSVEALRHSLVEPPLSLQERVEGSQKH